MNKQKLQDIADNTLSVTTGEIDEIKELIGNYPFFPLPHAVLAKVYFEKEHYLFENALNQAAMRVTDREWLYHYIHGDEKFNFGKDGNRGNTPAVNVETIVPEAVESREPGDDILHATTEVPVEETPEVGPKNDLSSFLEEEITTDNDIAVENIITENKADPEVEEVVGTGEEENEPGLIETNVVEVNATDEESDLSQPTEDNEEVLGETIDEQVVKTDEAFNEVPVQHPDIRLRKNPVYNVEEFLDDGKSHREPEGEGETGERDFFYWLNHPGRERAGTEKTAEKLEGEDEAPVNDKKLSIIEQFIKANPSISRPKKEFYNAENMAKRSEHLDFEFVTETLANIYYEQGNITLAIKAYEKLSLQNPLKKTYFASLIEKIKKEKR